MWETWVRSLSREDSLEKEIANHSSTLAWKIPWTEELNAGYCPWGHKDSDFHFHCGKPISNDLGHRAEAPFLGFGLGDELPSRVTTFSINLP